MADKEVNVPRGPFNYMQGIIGRVYHLYADGFRNMPLWGRRVWFIILIKLFIMFAILKIFFFPDLLKKNFSNDAERGDYVLEQITNKPLTDD